MSGESTTLTPEQEQAAFADGFGDDPYAPTETPGQESDTTPSAEAAAPEPEAPAIEYVQLTVSERVLGHGQLRPGLGFNDPLVHESVKRLSSLVSRDDVTGLLMRESIGEAVRLHLRDQYTLDRPEAGTPRRLTARSRRLIAEHLKDELASDISLERLAELAEMPVSAFVTAFTAAFGDTPYQYVLNRRIDEAQRLLASTDMAIRDVGTAVGFSTPSHFASTFRHRVGVTPSQYRSSARADL